MDKHICAQPSQESIVVNVLPLLNLNVIFIIYQSSLFIIGLTFAVIYTMLLDKYTMTCIHNYNIIWNSFTALMFSALRIHHSFFCHF